MPYQRIEWPDGSVTEIDVDGTSRDTPAPEPEPTDAARHALEADRQRAEDEAEDRRKIRELTAILGTLCKASKMPGLGWALPALAACPTGRRQAKVKGSGCSLCYARKGNFIFPNVAASHADKLQKVTQALETAEGRAAWVSAMTALLSRRVRREVPYFRIHVSGDFFDVEYFLMWLEVARNLPWIQFWAPTREAKIAVLAQRIAPPNLIVRYSGMMIGQETRGPGTVSMILAKGQKTPAGVSKCPAYTQGGRCLDCRACWDPAVKAIAYPLH